MKRILIASVFVVSLLSVRATYAQSSAPATNVTTPGVATPDTSKLKEYVGTYNVATGDIKQVIVTIERGKLVGEAVGLGQSALLPDATQPDAFTVPDPNGGSDAYATVQFGRDGGGKVAKVVVQVQGMVIEGTR